MKELVKYILIVSVGILGLYHLKGDTPFWHCLYFNVEYLSLATVIMYLAYMSRGVERCLFGVLSGYFALKIVYNTLLYIRPIGVKLGLNNSELWGMIFTGIVLVFLIITQLRYVLVKKG